MKHKQLAEPVAVRYCFDGYGYIYMDAGSGSDWASRVKDCEFLYTHPQKQAKEIEELKEDLKNRNINIEYLKEKLIASIDDIKTLKAELEDCTCQGGHSEAYLKVKGKK